ncbi:DNA methyltransferase [Lactobacillus sp. M0390]|uniref:DNA methyltransferase n=1 Tax=Lactobacillus sp. M0390 TaxID=2751026 RepID=UPI0018DBA2A1|nr:DNA methyltransferase [Lactobacillus sp. M0390]MBH9985833.1 DNA adenine methylase [Lactobacillus sp. M0390]
MTKDNNNKSNFWDYKGSFRTDLHTLGHYPATMVPEMQLKLMKDWKKNCYSIMLDPFAGSGTSLVEAQKLDMEVIGIDLNPYAILLSQVKTHDYSDIKWNKVMMRIHKKIESEDFRFPIHNFSNIKKWFRPDIIKSLSKIRNIIMSESDPWIRKFLWVCMSEVIYTHSNDRTSTFKLYQKPKNQIKSIPNDIYSEFEKVLSKKHVFLPQKKLPNSYIYSGDSISICSKIPTESVDMICTSPPYGENATTVTYGQSSILFLKWIDKNDLESSNLDSLLSNYSAIDSLSLGGAKADEYAYSSKTLEQYINSIDSSKQKKVRKFISDYWKIVKQLSRIIKKDGLIIFTVGNRVVDNETQPLDKLTIEMFEKKGINLVDEFSRNILFRQTPQRTSKINKKIKSMSKEKILVFRKGNKW